MIRAAWVVVALIFLARAVAAFTVPLTGDEAYYWEWSKRLAYGYVDHPPVVAWTIWLFERFASGAGAVRLGFVICGVVATLAMAATATLLSGDRRAGATAALLFSLAPLVSVAFVAATPDGPFLAFWCLSLYSAARVFMFGRWSDALLLGIALGGLLLSRLFGFAFLAGLIAFAITGPGRGLWRRGFALSLVVASAIYAPFVFWNAQHAWVTFTFSLVHRHEGEGGAGFSVVRFLGFLGTQALAYSPVIWVISVLAAVRPRNALVAWSGVPLLAGLAIFVLFRQVEVNWTLGCFASLCTLSGIVAVQLRPPVRARWAIAAIVPAAALTCLLFGAMIAPGPTYALARRATGLTLRNGGPFEVFAFQPLAYDVRRLVNERDAIAMTDGYGLSSVLDFDAGVGPVVIGYDWQGRESRMWYPSSMQPTRALFVDKEPLRSRPDFRIHLGRACARTFDGGSHAYRFGDAPPRTFYFTWCEGLRADGIAILRWEREPT